MERGRVQAIGEDGYEREGGILLLHISFNMLINLGFSSLSIFIVFRSVGEDGFNGIITFLCLIQ